MRRMRSHFYACAGALGPELIVNGDGTSIVGWTASSSTLSIVGGFLRVTSTAGFGRARQTFATLVGARYKATKTSQNGTAAPQVVVGSAPGLADLWNDGSAPGTASATFIATSANTTIDCIVNNAAAGLTADFKGISVRRLF